MIKKLDKLIKIKQLGLPFHGNILTYLKNIGGKVLDGKMEKLIIYARS